MKEEAPESIFNKAVGLILDKFCNVDEKIEIEHNVHKKTIFDYYSITGIASLGIKENTFIKTKYLSDDSLSIFKRVISDWIRKNIEHFGNINLVIITNLSRDRLYEKLKRQEEYYLDRIRFISIDELSFTERSSDIKDDGLPLISKKYSKCIPLRQIENIVYNTIRYKILRAALNEDISIERLVTKDKELFPFGYEDIDGRYHIFLKPKSPFVSKNILYREDTIKHRIEFISDSEEITILAIDGYKKEFLRINRNEFFSLLYIMILNHGYLLIPAEPQYKYRKFWNGKKKVIGIKIEDKIEIGSKSTIENNNIYFSAKEKLNAPFDIDVDITSYGLFPLENDYRIFCTTDRFDNILMWSHYADSHEGICTSYYPQDILDAIDKDADVAFSVFGAITYSNIRKPLLRDVEFLRKVLSNDLLGLLLQIICLFKKLKDWKYEKEFRYIVCLKNYKEHMTLTVPPRDFYFGNAFKFNANIKNYIFRYIKKDCYSFNLSKTRYKLVPVSIKLP